MNDKVPIVIIILVIIFILIFIVVIASYGDSSSSLKMIPYTNNKNKPNPLDNKTITNLINTTRESDAHTFVVNNLENNESIIFAATTNFSSVSLYKDDTLIYTKLFSGSNGFVISKNLQNVNASFFQIGKKFDLENLKYTYLPVIPENDSSLKVIISGVPNDTFRVYKCYFKYDVITEHNSTIKNLIDLPSFGISEYDIIKYIESQQENSEGYEKVLLQRTYDKKQKNQWSYKNSGSYIIYYVTGIYSYKIQDKNNNILIEEKKDIDKNSVRKLNKYLENKQISISHFYIENPNLTITNYDENIPEKNINADLVSLLNTPIEFYKHFVYGKKNIPIDIWNRIHNKIFIYKIT
jgi:hypothetical protein